MLFAFQAPRGLLLFALLLGQTAAAYEVSQFVGCPLFLGDPVAAEQLSRLLEEEKASRQWRWRRNKRAPWPASSKTGREWHEGFLATIAEHPDDNGPRLIYADWLDENGMHVFGDFIRYSLAHDQLARDPSHPLLPSLALETGLQAHRAMNLWGPLARHHGASHVQFEWNRGFVTGARLPHLAGMFHPPSYYVAVGEGRRRRELYLASTFRHGLESLFAQTPTLRAVSYAEPSAPGWEEEDDIGPEAALARLRERNETTRARFFDEGWATRAETLTLEVDRATVADAAGLAATLPGKLQRFSYRARAMSQDVRERFSGVLRAHGFREIPTDGGETTIVFQR